MSQFFKVRFDGYTLRGKVIHDQIAVISKRETDDGRILYGAVVIDQPSNNWNSIKNAIQGAASLAFNTQVNVTTIYSR